MIYVMSDIHGMYDKYEKMLELIDFKDTDMFYVLGDVIDRGDDGVKAFRDMMARPNVCVFLGNHEKMGLPILKAIYKLGGSFEEICETNAFSLWMANGGEPTALDFCKLFREEQKWMIKYMELLYTYDEIEVGGRRFHLSHTLPEYDEERGIHDVSLMEFVWGEPDYEICYDPDVTFITGHTPTGLIDPESAGKIWRGNGHIAIDCAAAYGGRLGCICLDTMEEFYV